MNRIIKIDGSTITIAKADGTFVLVPRTSLSFEPSLNNVVDLYQVGNELIVNRVSQGQPLPNSGQFTHINLQNQSQLQQPASMTGAHQGQFQQVAQPVSPRQGQVTYPNQYQGLGQPAQPRPTKSKAKLIGLTLVALVLLLGGVPLFYSGTSSSPQATVSPQEQASPQDTQDSPTESSTKEQDTQSEQTSQARIYIHPDFNYSEYSEDGEVSGSISLYYADDLKKNADDMKFVKLAYPLLHSQKIIFGLNIDDYVEPAVLFYRGKVPISWDGEEYEGKNASFYTRGVIFIDMEQLDEIAPNPYQKIYVLSHEMGHYIQDFLGILPKVNQLKKEALDKGDEVTANQYSIRTELQADYLAGVYSYTLEEGGLLKAEELYKTLETAKDVGDDVILGEHYNERTSNHGTAKQRMYWFMEGNRDAQNGTWKDNYMKIFEVDFDKL